MTTSERKRKLLELLALKRSGKSNVSTYEINEDPLYDEVDESTYNTQIEEEDDFIEVNNGDHSYTHNDGTNDIGGYGYSDDDDTDNKNHYQDSKSKKSNNKRRKVQTREPSPPPPPPPKLKSKDITEMFMKKSLKSNNKPVSKIEYIFGFF